MELSKEILEKTTFNIVEWIKENMVNSGGNKAVLGISGGKDSSVAAALCVEALGKENVIGVLMPNGVQEDLQDAKDLCSFLDIKCTIVNIENIANSFLQALRVIDKEIVPKVSNQSLLNFPPRIRMTLLYAVSQSIDNSRVINTSNISEDWIGYATIYGDTAGAFSPLGMLTSDEVIQIGEFIGLPHKFTIKVPSDGLTGKTDEDIFGFSYEVLNKYIRKGICKDEEIKKKIDSMHRYSRHKFLTIPMFNPSFEIGAKDISNVYK